MPRRQIIGIHSAGHDTGVCLWEDGRLLFSMETERLTRNRHESYVAAALEALRARPEFDPDAVELVALSTPVRESDINVSDYDAIMTRILNRELHVASRCRLYDRDYPCVVVAHEAAHAAIGLYEAGFEDGAIALVNEGRGIFSRNALFRYENGALTLEKADFLPWYATGFAWSAFGALLGFGKGPSVAGKVMALSGFAEAGEKDFDAIKSVREDLLRISAKERLEEAARLPVRPLADENIEENGRAVNALQTMFSHAIVSALKDRVAQGGVDKITLSGGCALNIITNSVLRNQFSSPIFVPPACNDAGQALGAALYVQKVVLGRNVETFPVYANGDAQPMDEIVRTLRENDLTFEDYDPDVVAGDLADGKVVAFFQGVSELGPRALGNRSILADPSLKGQKERVSVRIKGREWFRPLAPVMRAETFRSLWPGEGLSPYMLFNFDASGKSLDAASHVDGTARIQTVEREQNPVVHRLLEKFEKKSDAPGLVNTSLNAAGRPIARACQDVIDDFGDSSIDIFVFEQAVVRRASGGRHA